MILDQFLDLPQPCNLIGDGPEGPEVRIITEALQEKIQDCWLMDLKLSESSKMARHGFKGLDHLLLPLYVEKVFCKGKQIFFKLVASSEQLLNVFDIEDSTSLEMYLNCRLGMSGQWVWTSQDHCDLELVLEDSWGDRFSVWFRDARHTGEVEIHLPEMWEKKMSSIGPDLLSEEIALEQFQEKISIRIGKEESGKARKPMQICVFLMDQGYFSGIGNYVKAELLYRAKVAPNRVLADLSSEEISRIFDEARAVLQESYQVHGCTRHQGTYQDPEGNTGSYAEYLQVYEHKQDPLGNPVQKDTFDDKRTTHWVPEVQL